jgi:hypothetical protein
MNGLQHVNLIRFLDFYFTLLFIIGLMQRFGLYREVGHLILTGPRRWPRLMEVVKEHWAVFLTWGTMLPASTAMVLALAQIVASRYLWPHANLNVDDLIGHWVALPIVLPLAAAMLAMDLYCAFVIGKFDRAEMEKYFDDAEYWLGSHTAHIVRFFTFGYVDPRRMVGVEVQKAMHAANQLLRVNLWWMAAQVGLRVAFGLALWGTWVLTEM